MRRVRGYIVLACLTVMTLVAPVACSWNGPEYDREFANTPQGNFAALWTIMDEHYCFFELKERELGVDWDKVFENYSQSISDKMSDRSLFEVLCSMIGELCDGHVNLSSPYDFGRNWHWKTDYPLNFSKDLQDEYLGTDYKIIGNGYKYTIFPDNIGYLVVESFNDKASESRLNSMFNDMVLCNGLIIDIRNNGGGDLTASEQLASRFTEKKVLTGYSYYKNGPGHNDFSKPEENWLEPDKYNLRWKKPVVVITNRSCYSSANDFACIMKVLPTVTLLGDTTGGGGGLPMSQELPNGWVVRFSSAPTLDASKQHIESGIAPHVVVNLTHDDILRCTDTMIEAARNLINNNLINP